MRLSGDSLSFSLAYMREEMTCNTVLFVYRGSAICRTSSVGGRRPELPLPFAPRNCSSQPPQRNFPTTTSRLSSLPTALTDLSATDLLVCLSATLSRHVIVISLINSSTIPSNGELVREVRQRRHQDQSERPIACRYYAANIYFSSSRLPKRNMSSTSSSRHTPARPALLRSSDPSRTDCETQPGLSCSRR